MSRQVFKESSGGDWSSFDAVQRTGAIVACTLTFLRPALAGIAAVRIAIGEEPSWKDAALVGTAFATDADGTVARAFNAETDLGKHADPIADKVSMGMIEAALARKRGGLAITLLAVRAMRDITVSVVRRNALDAGCSANDIKANGFGKASTGARMGVALAGSSPLGRRHEKLLNTGDTVSTTLTVVSGAITVTRIWRKRREVKA